MCGIAGHYKFRSHSETDKRKFSHMTESLSHRGPDNQSIWYCKNQKLALGHTRLSIQDLSNAGNQPMISRSQRYVIVFNGEIYNHLDIRSELPFLKSFWRGRSDTETLIESINFWGFEKSLKKLEGMFAFAIFDNQENCLYLCRDRFGEKPLYFGKLGENDSDFIFASELQAISDRDDFQNDIDFNSVNNFLRYNNVGGHRSIYKNIHKLLPGHYLEYNFSKKIQNVREYWSPVTSAISSKTKLVNINFDDAVNETESLLRSTVKKQMISDVPLGCFLSGGIDSSLIASLMQSESKRPINTFTIGLDEAEIDEAKNSRKIANYLGTNHTELCLSQNKIIDIIPKALNLYSEPFADSSQIPTLLVSMMAKKHVSVALTGDAGDELFGGYNRYSFVDKYWRGLSAWPLFIRKSIYKNRKTLSPIIISLLKKLNADNEIGAFELKMQKVLSSLHSKNEYELHEQLISSEGYDQIIIGNNEFSASSIENDSNFSDVERMMLKDTIEYLPNDILVKVDRAAMSQSLETRAPFLDHKLFELLWSFPKEFKVNKGKTKLISKAINSKYLPSSLVNQPKTGFGIPLKDWIRDQLFDFCETTIFHSPISSLEIIDMEKTRSIWKDHIDGVNDYTSILWNIIVLGSWFENKKK